MTGNSLYLQQIMKNCRRRAKVLAVTSGKGGVGKTNIAANLAICMAANNKKTVLLDADLSLGNLDIIMNINSKYNISHMINGRKSLEEIIHTGPEGVEIICGVGGLEELANIGEFQQQRLLKKLEIFSHENDTIVIDTAAGISKSVVGFCLASDQTLVVTTPEPPAMTDAYAVIKVLSAHNYTGRISLLVNMADTVAQGKRTYKQVSSVASRFLDTHVYSAGVLVRDERLAWAVGMRKPVVLAYPKAKVTIALATLASKLSNSSVQQPSEGFFNKVVNWFF